MSAEPPVVRICDLTIRFGDFVALEGVNLNVMRGSSTGIIGPNGAGKTTLFHALSADIRPDRGTVQICGMDVTRHEPAEVARLGVGKQFQDIRIFKNLKVKENLLLALQAESDRQWYRAWFQRPSALRRRQWDERVNEILQTIELTEKVNELAGNLSYGNQKSLAFGRLLAGGFKVLLLDEPMAGLSPQRAAKLGEMIRRAIQHTGTTILLIEHNMQHVRELCERTIVLNRGKVLDEGPTAEILGKESVREVCLGL